MDLVLLDWHSGHDLCYGGRYDIRLIDASRTKALNNECSGKCIAYLVDGV